MSLEVFQSPEQAAHAVMRQLGLGSCPPAACLFEILRATVWSMAAPESKAHVNRVLSAALPTWQLLSEPPTASEEMLRTALREALSALADAGDLIELSGGYWAPAMSRFVQLPNGAGYLLVGGVPSALLNLDLKVIEAHGLHRHLARLPPELAAVLPLEDFQSWARLPDRSLEDWALTVFDSLERQPYSPTNTDSFEFYLPAKSRAGSSQYFRWFESAGDVTGTLLARRLRLYGAREFRLLDVRAGRIVSACELYDVDVRRLMYALDLAAKNPVRAVPLPVGARTEWLFTSELPRAEQRTFAALGTLTIPNDRSFERRWTFLRNEELALGMLRSLGIALGQQPQEERR